VVEGLDRSRPGQRVKNEAVSGAPVRDFDAEVIGELLAVPEEIDDDSAGLTVCEMTPANQNVSAAPRILRMRASRLWRRPRRLAVSLREIAKAIGGCQPIPMPPACKFYVDNRGNEHGRNRAQSGRGSHRVYTPVRSVVFRSPDR
jgi:hypothetical protein